MDANWIVTANAGRARIFSQATDGAALEEVEDLVNDASRLRTADTESDERGREAGPRSGHGAGARATPSDGEAQRTPAQHQAERFARDVAGRLAEARTGKRFRHLVVAAAPAFLGMLRASFDAELAGCVRLEIDRDFTQSTAAALREQVKAHRFA